MTVRLATYNVEWFSSLFGNDDQLLLDRAWSGRRDVVRRDQLKALRTVFRAIDADGVLIVEAPDQTRSKSTERALLNFAKYAGLRLDTVAHGFANDTQQEIAFLYDKSAMSAKHVPLGGTDPQSWAPRFDGTFMLDIDSDGAPESHKFSKPPLELVIDLKGQAEPLHMIGVHVKSKAPHGARNPEDEVRISIQNRHKQLAQCQWLRRRVERHLDDDHHVLVMGDFNDGPGLDEYEKLFGRSGVEVVLRGDSDEANDGDKDGNEKHAPQANAQLFDPHAAARLNPRDSWSPSTARFFQHRRGKYLNALLDYVMVSQSVKQAFTPSWKIWHPFDDGQCFKNKKLRRALLTASDHFPVTIDLDMGDLTSK